MQILAHALMGINAVKGVEIGDGFAVVEQRGSQHRDEMTPNGFESNHAGGILGGISSGQPIIATIALKPTSSITIPGRSINLAGESVEVVTKGVMILVWGFVQYPLRRQWLQLFYSTIYCVLRHNANNSFKLSLFFFH